MPTFPRPPIIPYAVSPVRWKVGFFRWRLPDFHARLSLLPKYSRSAVLPPFGTRGPRYPALSRDADSIVHPMREITTPTQGLASCPSYLFDVSLIDPIRPTATPRRFPHERLKRSAVNRDVPTSGRMGRLIDDAQQITRKSAPKVVISTSWRCRSSPRPTQCGIPLDTRCRGGSNWLTRHVCREQTSGVEVRKGHLKSLTSQPYWGNPPYG